MLELTKRIVFWIWLVLKTIGLKISLVLKETFLDLTFDLDLFE